MFSCSSFSIWEILKDTNPNQDIQFNTQNCYVGKFFLTQHCESLKQ